MIAKVGGYLVLPVACIFGFLAFMFRFDDAEEHALSRRVDVFAGALFALYCFLICLGRLNESPRKWAVIIFATLGTWAVVSGSLLLVHEMVARVRFDGSLRAKTTNLTMGACNALQDYREDCGDYPSNDQGLIALRKNPGHDKWAGPYLTADYQYVDAWGNPLQYHTDEDRARVWSYGPDGVNGTDDDISVEVSRRKQEQK